MTISWGNWSVRVYAAEAWVSIASRFAVEHSIIVDHLESILADPVPAVRLQAAKNLQVICVAAPDRMWEMGEKLAAQETNTEVIASYLNHSLRRFSHSDPDRCETVLKIVIRRLNADLVGEHKGRDFLLESVGNWTAQLYVVQGRGLARDWLENSVTDPEHYGDFLNSFIPSLRRVLFDRYSPAVDEGTCEMCNRAQESLALILSAATALSAKAYSIFTSDVSEGEKLAAQKQYGAVERVIHNAMNQLYFGSGAYAGDRGDKPGLPNAVAMKRFMTDFADILALLAKTREPATLHHLIQLYEFLIPGDPVKVFEAIHNILLGRGEEEGYHYESLGSTAVVRIVQLYIADYRSIFDDEGRRAKLVAILQLFSEAGWTEALKLLYDLPDLLR